MTTQDPELSAALGWPGGISDPVLDRVQLLRMVAALRVAAKQALEALLNFPDDISDDMFESIRALKTALAQEQEQVKPIQLRPLHFANLIKGKETMTGVPVYWAEWPSKETP